MRILLLLLISSVCHAITTYYVDPAGSDSNDGGSTGAAWATIAKVNGSTFNAGDSVLLKRGGVWREYLSVPPSGASGNPVTFGNYGSGALPIITGADVITGWSASGSNWTKAMTTQPKQVFVDGVRLVLGASAGAVTAGQFFWGSNLLTVRMADSSNPSGHTVEASQRDQAIYINGKSHLVFDGIQAEKGNFSSFYIVGIVDDLMVKNSIIADGYVANLSNNNASDEHTNTVTIQDTTIGNAGGTGIAITDHSDAWTLQRLTVTGNCTLATEPDNHLYTAGIRAATGAITNIIVQDSTVYDNGAGNTGDRGAGIWFDTTSGTGNKIRRNTVYGNRWGLMLEVDSGSEASYNKVYSHTANEGGAYGYGILVQRNTHGAKVWNNVVYDNRIGILVMGDFPAAAGNMTGNDIRNNLVTGSISTAFAARYGAENDGTHGSGNVYVYNGFGPQSANFIEWGASNFLSTYSAWATTYGSATHALTVDPLFVAPLTQDFRLLSTSAAIGAGVDVGLTADFAGVPISGAPSMGIFQTPFVPTKGSRSGVRSSGVRQ